jgi:hypothetical protein
VVAGAVGHRLGQRSGARQFFFGRVARPIREVVQMIDVMWLLVCGGLFLLTLAYTQLCDKA